MATERKHNTCTKCGTEFGIDLASGSYYGPKQGQVKISSYYGQSIYLRLCDTCAHLLTDKLKELEKEFTQVYDINAAHVFRCDR